jgi:deoxyribodipyrimidine photo-lyase
MQKALVWLRRDLRLYDNAALHHALKNNSQVWVSFIFDTNILEPLRTEDLPGAGGEGEG